MTTRRIGIFLFLLLSSIGIKSYAFDFSAKNADGVTIYYSYINNGQELAVDRNSNKGYEGTIVIPEEVTYMNRTRKVTSISSKGFELCSVTSVSIPNTVTSIGESAFAGCNYLKSVNIPDGVKNLGKYVFNCCSSLTSIIIPSSVTSIGFWAFNSCRSLETIILPKNITNIGESAFDDVNLSSIVSQIENPFPIFGKSSRNATFSRNTFYNATLYVPKGTLEKYKETEGWKDFVYIEEVSSDFTKCEKPTINYQNGKLTFKSATEGVSYSYNISDSDIKTGVSQEVQLGVTYVISVYAFKNGLEDSDTAIATLCWIDVEPKSEGLSDGISQRAARAIMVKSERGQLIIEGAEDNTNISVYDLNGEQHGSTVSINGTATVSTNLNRDSIAILKIGNRSVKIMMK